MSYAPPMTSSEALTLSSLPFRGGMISRGSTHQTGIGVPTGTDLVNVERLAREHALTWEPTGIRIGDLVSLRPARLVGRVQHYVATFSAL